MADINIMNTHAFIFRRSDSKHLMQLSQPHSFYTVVKDSKTLTGPSDQTFTATPAGGQGCNPL